MPNFIFDAVALPASKQDYIPASQGTVPATQVCQASDWNSVFTALSDIRTDLKFWQGTTTAINYSALTTDYAVYCNATGITITLPAGAVGLTYLIKDITGNASPNITVATTSSQNIDGVTTKTISSAYGWIAVVWDVTNTQWRITSQTAGGASLGNFTFSTNAQDLSVGSTMTIGGTTATGVTVGRTNGTTTINSGLVSLRSGTADGASAVACAVDTTTTWSNATAKLFSWRTNTTEKAFVLASGGGRFASLDAAASGAWNLGGSSPNATTITVQGSTAALLKSPGGSGTIQTDDSTGSALNYGSFSVVVSSSGTTVAGPLVISGTGAVARSPWYSANLGSQLTAAATITPTSGLHHVTGATTINIIALTNVPSGTNVFETLIADSTITFGSSASAGGIKVAPGTTLASGKAMTFVLDNSTQLWYPVQGA